MVDMRSTESLGMSVNKEELRKEMFFDLEKTYFIKENREQGERWLAEIAEKVDVEYVWAFDQETSTWHHLIAEKIDLSDAKIGKLRHGFTLPNSLMRPPSQNSILYHIHPTLPMKRFLSDPETKKTEHTADVMMVRNQLPSIRKSDAPNGEGDIESAITLLRNGYKGFKFVTPLGITTIEYDIQREEQVHFPHTLTLKYDDLVSAIKLGGVIGGIEDQLQRWNAHNQGIYTISFEPFDKSPVPTSRSGAPNELEK